MRVLTGKLYKRVSLFTLSLMFMVGSLGVAVPLYFSQIAHATVTPPVAVDDSYSTHINTALSVAAPGVLLNDTNIDSVPFHTIMEAAPANGTLNNGNSVAPDGSFVYTPDSDYVGLDSFTYYVTPDDPNNDTNNTLATVTINVYNTAPVTVDDSYSTPMNTSLNIVAPGILINDTDADGDAMYTGVNSLPAHGTLTNGNNVFPDGSFVYTPDSGYVGTDSFTYYVDDNQVLGNTSTVTINVTPVYNGAVTISPIGGVFTTNSIGNRALDAVFTITTIPIESDNITTFSGMVQFTSPSNSCSFNATVNANGYDTFFFEIGSCTTTPIAGHTYLVGEYASQIDSFLGTFINQTSAMVPTTGIAITGATTVGVGRTETYHAATTPSYASGEVRWSVWSGTGGGSAIIDSVSGELTGTSAGSVTVIASILNAPVFTKNYDVKIVNVPAAPTNVHFKQGAGTIPSGTVLNGLAITSNIQVVWDASGTDAYKTEISYPDTTIATKWTGTQNLWIGETLYSNNLFGQKGEGFYSYRVMGRSATTGLWSDWSDKITLGYDTTKPTASFTSATSNPMPNGAYNGDFNVDYLVQDNVILKSVSVALFDTDSSHSNHWVANCYNNAIVGSDTSTGTCTVHIPASAPEGTYYMQIGGQDMAGYWTVAARRTITIDRTAPVVTIDGVSPKAFYNDDTSISVHVSDMNYAKTEMYHSGDLSPFKTYTGAWFGLSWLSDGDYHLVAIDSAGNETSYDFTIDTTGPVAPSLMSPIDGEFISGNPVQSWSHSDPSDVDHYIYESCVEAACTHQIYTTTTTNTQRTIGGIQNITFWWRVAAVDDLGNIGPWSSVWEVTVDNTNPVATITNPITAGPFAAGTIDIKGSIADSNLSHYYLRISDSSDSTIYTQTVYTSEFTNQSLYSWDTSGLPDGDYTIFISARDLAGNKDGDKTTPGVSVDSAVVTIDNNAPEITVTGGDLTLETGTTYVDQGATWLDAIDGGPYAATETSNTVDTSTPGIYVVTYSATDAAGNNATATRTLTVKDTTKPIVTLDPITSPNGGSINSVNITGTVSDIVGVTDYELSINGSVVATGIDTITPYDWNISRLASGTYTVILTATDAAGNTNSATQDVVIDNTTPVITYVGYDEIDNVITPDISITGNYDRFSWTANSSNPSGVTYNDLLVAPSFTVVNDGDYTFTLTAIDVLGNQTSRSFSFTYTAPVVVPTLTIAPTTPAVVPPQFTNVVTTPTEEGTVLGDQTDQPSDTNSDDSTTDNTDVKGVNDTKNNAVWSIFGLAWYWWLLIIAAIASIWWIISVAISRNSQES